jgi:HEPN domain-containing protein
MTKEDHIKYWIESAQSDWESVDLLFKGNKFIQALFFCHLTLEKISKALFVKHSEEIYPPKTHDINKLLEKTKLKFSNEILIFLRAFNV